MTIERLHFEKPWVLDKRVPASAQIELVIAMNAHKITPLAEGDYHLTPSVWTKHNYEHDLRVNRDGTGTYTMSPRGRDVGTFILEGSAQSEVQSGPRVVEVGEEFPIVPLIGGIPRTSDLGIFEIIIYTPNPQPPASFV